MLDRLFDPVTAAGLVQGLDELRFRRLVVHGQLLHLGVAFLVRELIFAQMVADGQELGEHWKCRNDCYENPLHQKIILVGWVDLFSHGLITQAQLGS